MKFRSRTAKRAAKIAKWTNWRSRFAWFPRKIEQGTVVWLERYAVCIKPGQSATDDSVRVFFGPHNYILAQPEVTYRYGESFISDGSKTKGLETDLWYWWQL